MRWQALVVLLAIAISVVAPPSLPWLSNSDSEASIGTLDLCHASAPALTGTGDTPCLHECPCQPLHLPPIAVTEIPRVTLKPLFIAFQDERPPQA